MIYDEDYFENGISTGKSLYQNFRWMPELTIPMAYNIVKICECKDDDIILDFGCAKGYLVKALRLLGHNCFGFDISEYAISQAPKDVEKYIFSDLKSIEKVNWVIAKDVLEHIPYDKIDEQLEILSNFCNNIFVIVPIGNGEKYNSKAYEMDPTHHIKEDLDWWKQKLNCVGYTVTKATYNMRPFKENWSIHEKGNGLLIGKK